MRLLGRTWTERQEQIVARLAANAGPRDCVAAASEMERIDCPTWRAVRRARRQGFRVTVAYPDGRVDERTVR